MLNGTSYTFEPDAHVYRIGGRKVPGVTKVLADLIPGWAASDWYMRRGQVVHACAALCAQDKAFEHSPEVDGQVKAIRRYLDEVRPRITEIERQVYSRRYQYAGTLDLMDGNKVVDYKASIGPSLPYQLAAYAIAYGETEGCADPRQGYGVEIRADGTFKCTEVFDFRRYKAEWLCLLSAYNTRRHCRIPETEEKDSE